MTAYKKPNGDYVADTLRELRKVSGGKDLTAFGKLNALTEGLYERFGTAHGAAPQERTPEIDARWADLLDLMYYFDEDAKRDKPVHARVNMPDADPLTLINRLQDEGFLNKRQGSVLRRDFDSQVRAIIGKKLTQDQVAALRSVILDFDVGKTLRPEGDAPGTPGQG